MGTAGKMAIVGNLTLGNVVTAGITNGIVSAARAGSGKAFWGGFVSGAAFSFAGGLGGRFGPLGSYAGHAGAGCISAVAGGGKCGQGAMNALAGKFTSTTLRANGMGAEGGVGGFMGGLVATSLAGGVMSELQGGKFEDGAKIGAQGYLYNEVNKKIEEVGKKLWTTFNFVKDARDGYRDGYQEGQSLRNRHDAEVAESLATPTLSPSRTQFLENFNHPFQYYVNPGVVWGPGFRPPSPSYIDSALRGYADGYNRREYREPYRLE